jgi:hypothetical protein
LAFVFASPGRLNNLLEEICVRRCLRQSQEDLGSQLGVSFSEKTYIYIYMYVYTDRGGERDREIKRR